jgi:hypothetical protein
VPELPEERLVGVKAQLDEAGVTERHEIVVRDGGEGLRLLAAKGLRPSSMGRTIDETPELFVAAPGNFTHDANVFHV